MNFEHQVLVFHGTWTTAPDASPRVVERPPSSGRHRPTTAGAQRSTASRLPPAGFAEDFRRRSGLARSKRAVPLTSVGETGRAGADAPGRRWEDGARRCARGGATLSAGGRRRRGRRRGRRNARRSARRRDARVRRQRRMRRPPSPVARIRLTTDRRTLGCRDRTRRSSDHRTSAQH